MAQQTQLILTQDVHALGRAGELVRVRPGYARNFLLPRGLALVATAGNVAQLEHHKRVIARRQEQIRADYQRLASTLSGVSVAIARKVGKDGRLFGSVGSRDITEALAAQNIQLDRKLIHLDEPLREAGTFEVTVRFSQDVTVGLKVNVVGI
jgi:large subunit ribosomal protein L9